MDENGNIVNETYLTPFGEVALESETVRNNFRFPGQYHDRESMLYYNWNRYYIPSVGRYNTVDPLYLIFDNLHLYPFNYAKQNPIFYTDPRGLLFPPIILIGPDVEVEPYPPVPCPLLGTADECSYYDAKCISTKCSYYCDFAVKYCWGFGLYDKFQWTRCTRRCLISYDDEKCNIKDECGKPNCDKIKRCNFWKAHPFCYLKCASHPFSYAYGI